MSDGEGSDHVSRTAALQHSYDLVAEEYAGLFFDELAQKPLDRALLDCFTELVGHGEPVIDLGCGPGQIARYLHDRGLRAVGLDVSAGMVANARRLSPGIEFVQGSMVALDFREETWAGITAFYSVIHLEPHDRPRAFSEFHRVLRADGPLLIAYHVGSETVHRDELWGEHVDLDFHFLDTMELQTLLQGAGFAVDAVLERQPYTATEHPSRRGYILARKAAK